MQPQQTAPQQQQQQGQRADETRAPGAPAPQIGDQAPRPITDWASI